MNSSRGFHAPITYSAPDTRPPAVPPQALYDLLPADHRMSYDMHALLQAVVDDGLIDEFQPDLAKEMICGDARIEGMTVGIIANQRGVDQRPSR